MLKRLASPYQAGNGRSRPIPCGLSDEEIRELDAWVRRHTRERFGPVRAVEPTQVFELAFEGIAASSRHRSGVAVRFPRILRWRKDKAAAEADRLETLKAMIVVANETEPRRRGEDTEGTEPGS